MKITDSAGNNETPLRRIGKGARYAISAAMLFLASCANGGNIFQKPNFADFGSGSGTLSAKVDSPVSTSTITIAPTNPALSSFLNTPTTQPVVVEAEIPKSNTAIIASTVTPITDTPSIDYKATNVVLGEDLVKEKAKVKELEDQLKAEKAMAQLNSIDSTYIEERLELVINLCTYCYQELTITSGITSTGNETVTFNLGTKTNLNIDMSGFTKTYTTEMGSVFMVDDRMVSQFESFIMLNYIPELLNKPTKNALEQRIADRVTKNMKEGRKLLDSLVFAIREFDKVLGLEIFIPNDGCAILPAKATGTPTPTGTTPPTATSTPTPTQNATGTRPPEPSSTPGKEEPTTVPTRRIEPSNTPPQPTATSRVDNTNTPPPPPEPTVRVEPTGVKTRIIP